MYCYANQIFELRENFIIIGLTGRTGSGCTTAAKILANKIPDIENLDIDFEERIEQREYNIIKNFAQKHWHGFYHIRIKDIISTFILENTFDDTLKYIKDTFSVDISDFKNIYNSFFEKNKCINNILADNNGSKDTDNDIYNYISYCITKFSTSFQLEINRKSSGDTYTRILQSIGDNIRKSGNAFSTYTNNDSTFAIPKRINSLIKIIRRMNRHKNNKKNYFVIDAIRNPMEIHFFREKYAAFYLIAINCSDKDREDRLLNSDFTRTQIREIDKKENPQGDFLESEANFFGQNIKICISMAEFYINNSEKKKSTTKESGYMRYQLTRMVSLIQHPGLVKPSSYEMLMQIAVTAATRSGCLSRNVGAVVSDSQCEPLAIGWNCVPRGQVPCYLRDIDGLQSTENDVAYSQYEKSTKNFITEIEQYDKKHFQNNEAFEKSALPKLYCFKSIKSKADGDKNQVHTRALHAEENAFLQVAKHGNNQIYGGILFTSASPCVLCAKKAYQFGIKEIVYLDPYPDISEPHILSSGYTPVKMNLYTGAIGIAFHKLYTSMLPLKDEIATYKKKE